MQRLTTALQQTALPMTIHVSEVVHSKLKVGVVHSKRKVGVAFTLDTSYAVHSKLKVGGGSSRELLRGVTQGACCTCSW